MRGRLQTSFGGERNCLRSELEAQSQVSFVCIRVLAVPESSSFNSRLQSFKSRLQLQLQLQSCKTKIFLSDSPGLPNKQQGTSVQALSVLMSEHSLKHAHDTCCSRRSKFCNCGKMARLGWPQEGRKPGE